MTDKQILQAVREEVAKRLAEHDGWGWERLDDRDSQLVPLKANYYKLADQFLSIRLNEKGEPVLEGSSDERYSLEVVDRVPDESFPITNFMKVVQSEAS